MSEEIVIISPEISAGSGGVADYTLRLMQEWGDRVKPRVILPNDVKLLGEKLARPSGKILLQYSAYGYDSVGYPRQLLQSLLEWKKGARGLLVIMFHEIWAFWPWLNWNRLVQRQHRVALAKLVAVADAVFTSTPSQAEHLRKLAPQSNVQVMPVGSNIRRTAKAAPESGLAVVFGLQLSRLRALRTMRKELTALAQAGVVKKMMTFGAQNTVERDTEERASLTHIRLTNGFEMRGAIPEAEISQSLSRASFAISAQDELSLMKSGTFMAYAAHELNIVSPAADAFAAEPICWLTSPAELVNGISPNELKSRAENLRAWQERTSSWPIIAGRFAEALGL